MLAQPDQGLFMLAKRMQNFAQDGNMSAALMPRLVATLRKRHPF